MACTLALIVYVVAGWGKLEAPSLEAVEVRSCFFVGEVVKVMTEALAGFTGHVLDKLDGDSHVPCLSYHFLSPFLLRQLAYCRPAVRLD